MEKIPADATPKLLSFSLSRPSQAESKESNSNDLDAVARFVMSNTGPSARAHLTTQAGVVLVDKVPGGFTGPSPPTHRAGAARPGSALPTTREAGFVCLHVNICRRTFLRIVTLTYMYPFIRHMTTRHCEYNQHVYNRPNRRRQTCACTYA